jgi:hypothetical protein
LSTFGPTFSMFFRDFSRQHFRYFLRPGKRNNENTRAAGAKRANKSNKGAHWQAIQVSHSTLDSQADSTTTCFSTKPTNINIIYYSSHSLASSRLFLFLTSIHFSTASRLTSFSLQKKMPKEQPERSRKQRNASAENGTCGGRWPHSHEKVGPQSLPVSDPKPTQPTNLKLITGMTLPSTPFVKHSSVLLGRGWFCKRQTAKRRDAIDTLHEDESVEVEEPGRQPALRSRGKSAS